MVGKLFGVFLHPLREVQDCFVGVNPRSFVAFSLVFLLHPLREVQDCFVGVEPRSFVVFSLVFLLHPLREVQDCFVGVDPRSFVAFSLVFLLVNQYCSIIDGICTLIDVVIVAPIQANLVSWATFSYGVATTMATQLKEGLYYNYYLVEEFLLEEFLSFAIEVFGCLYHQSNSFHHQALMSEG
jgi:hypothetical protein